MELECEVELEWAPYPSWPKIETTFEVMYEMDGGVQINGIYLQADAESDHDYNGELTDDQMETVLMACIDDYSYRCDMEQAAIEDAADTRAQMMREERQYELEQRATQRSLKEGRY